MQCSVDFNDSDPDDYDFEFVQLVEAPDECASLVDVLSSEGDRTSERAFEEDSEASDDSS